MNLKKINFKQPKYILPLILVPVACFIVWQFASIFDGGSSDSKQVVATDSLNMSLPDANVDDNERTKMDLMQGRYGNDDDAYTAVNGIDSDNPSKDSVDDGYSNSDKDRIDRDNAELERQRKAEEELQRSLNESSRHVNAYSDYGGSGRSSRRSSSRSRSDEVDDYAKEIAAIQRRSLAAQKAIDAGTSNDYDSYEGGNGYGPNPGLSQGYRSNKPKKKEQKTEIVRKAETKNADKFNTVSAQKIADDALIKAMIDKTTKAREGTRLRFKLLDDVTLSGIKLKKGTYLYGLVTGFGQQRVKADITSVLVGNKFLKVHLSVYDNDGMEGFYVPSSEFRELVKNAGSQAMQSNMQFNNGYGGSELSGENIALQALQNVYQSATSAVSANIRKNKARIKYNTIVYLINTQENQN